MANDEKSITILCVNDFHAEILPTNRTLGSARLAGAIHRFKRDNPDTIVVFGGDNFKGDPIAEYFRGEPVTNLMRTVGAVASAVGNHDFDFGIEQMRDWQVRGAFSFLAANVMDKSSLSVPDFVKPYLMVERNGLKIAFIGLSTKEPMDNVDRPRDIHALEIADGVEIAKKWVEYLQAGNDPLGKPDAIIALTHYGLKLAVDDKTPVGEEAISLCRQVPGLAGVLTAHWHQFMSLDIEQVAVAQGGSHGKGFALLTLRFTHDHRLLRVTPSFIDYSDSLLPIEPDERIEAQVEHYHRLAMEELGAVIGVAKSDIVHRSPAGNEVLPEGTPLSKLAVHVMQQATGSAIAMMYAGRMGSGIKQGNITLYLLNKVLFFANRIVTMKLQGRDIVRNIENGICTLKREGASPLAFGGVRVTADYAKPFGQRIETIALEDGTPLMPEKYYAIAVDEFLASDEMGYDFSNGADRIVTDGTVRSGMIESIRANGGLDEEMPTNFTLKNKPRIGGDAICR
ncbi:bifunctional metallophosphatase/5'-nucleotidase [Paenibacillus glycinis]|uniref:Bifunctional metallophosphatase/5'-nucleotidase n=1 Tax=Paenibacillus glycinis TaxID=2697035 RepID=A0ABW9XQB9_9BACL|nr:5'-nucleotidase C-terminal domain-containing protein [Paenibacillus glycinis]NBD24844.1 hypothetical protein [Paenibacillus glycinis]